MKKYIIATVLVLSFMFPLVTNAQTVEDKYRQSLLQLISLLQQKVEMLVQQLNDLQKEVVSMPVENKVEPQIVQTVTPVVEVQKVEPITPIVEVPKVEAPILGSVPTFSINVGENSGRCNGMPYMFEISLTSTKDKDVVLSSESGGVFNSNKQNSVTLKIVYDRFSKTMKATASYCSPVETGITFTATSGDEVVTKSI